jgi:hypothetical protein
LSKARLLILAKSPLIKQRSASSAASNSVRYYRPSRKTVIAIVKIAAWACVILATVSFAVGFTMPSVVQGMIAQIIP